MKSGFLFAAIASFAISSAVFDLNRVSLFSFDGALILAGAAVLIGFPIFAAWIGLGKAARATSADVSPSHAAAGVFLILWAGAVALAAMRAPSLADLRFHGVPLVFLVVFLLSHRITPLRHSPAMASLFAGAIALIASLTAAPIHRALAGHPQFAQLKEKAKALRTEARYEGRILIIGVDGLSWEFLRLWSEQGDNSDYQWLLSRSFAAPLSSMLPTASPLIWTSMATGTLPEDHGVVGFTSHQWAGLEQSRVRIPRFIGAFYWHRLMLALRLSVALPVSSLDVKQPPVWEIIGSAETPIDVLGWWASHPAQPVYGRLVTDKYYFARDEALDTEITYTSKNRPTWGFTFPPALEFELASSLRNPDDVAPDVLRRFVNATADSAILSQFNWQQYDPLSELRFAYSMDETHFDIADRLINDGPDNATLFYYFRGVDLVSHGNYRFSNLYPEAAGVDPMNRATFGDVISRYYEYTFGKLRRLIESAGEDTLVVIVSDHGWEKAADVDTGFGHDSAPDGSLFVLGPGVNGTTSPASFSIMDLAPSVLWLRGYPVAQDMPGRVWAELFSAESEPNRVLSTYGYRLPKASESAEQTMGKADEDMLKLLKSLGYL